MYSVFVTDFSKERIVFVNQKLKEYRIEYTIWYLTIRKNEQFELFVRTLADTPLICCVAISQSNKISETVTKTSSEHTLNVIPQFSDSYYC